MSKTRRLTLTAIFAALIFVVTFLLKFPLPGGNGYIHLGDSFIYLVACILPFPYAMVAASLGGVLSDALGGYAQYMIPTLIIKALLVIPFTRKSTKLLSLRNTIAPVIAMLVTTFGYFFADCVITKDVKTALSYIGFNIIQAGASLVVFYVIAYAFDKLNIKDKVNK